ncbi:MAG: alpha-amylase family glycosyl hydrolase [Candidatus Eremiobacterota bacterium]
MVDRIEQACAEAQKPAPAAPSTDVDPDVNTRPWQDDILYMVMVDRYANGDPSNDGTVDKAHPWKRHGGDLRGLIDRLDYLADLGVTALWIDPVDLNQEDGYHGYWPVDFDKVDPRRGTLETLNELREKANERGIKLVLDRVINHTGYDHPWPKDPEKEEWFHHSGSIKWVSQEAIEEGELHGLPDLAQENPEVAKFLIDNDREWIRRTGVQGYRLDAVKHVPADFWKDYSKALHEEGGDNFLLIGEVFRGVPEYIARYQREDGIDSVFDVPLCDAVRNTLTADPEEDGPGFMTRLKDVIKNRKHLLFNEALRKLRGSDVGDMRNLSEVFQQDGTYVNPNLLATVIDNHDMSRFLTEAGENARAKLKLALALLLSTRGIPVILYGTESAMEGQAGQDNRADMQFDRDPDMKAYLKSLISLRRNNVELRRGEQRELAADLETYSFARVHAEGTSVVVLNNSRDPQQRSIPVSSVAGDGDRFRDLLTGRELVVRRGRLEVELDPKQPMILKRSTSA